MVVACCVCNCKCCTINDVCLVSLLRTCKLTENDILSILQMGIRWHLMALQLNPRSDRRAIALRSL